MAVLNGIEIYYQTEDLTSTKFVKYLHHRHDEIEQELPILDIKDSKSLRCFLQPRGKLCVNFIHLAAYSDRLEILKLADFHKVHLCATDSIGRTALHYAAGQGCVNIVKWLVGQSTVLDKLSLPDTFGMTALHLAVIAKHVRVVKILVNSQADVNLPNKYEMTPFHLASMNINRDNPEEISRYENIIQILLDSMDFRKFHDFPRSGCSGDSKSSKMKVLNGAVRLNSLEVTEKLLKRGLIIPRELPRIRRTVTALHIAAHEGFNQIICILLKHQVLASWMMDIRDELEETPLCVAVIQGQLECAKTLINNGGNLAAEGKYGLTVIDALFRCDDHPTNFLRDILDGGVSLMENHPNRVTLNFEILAPRGKRQMAVISALIRATSSMEQMNILQHPLVEAFLRLKWNRLLYSFIILMAFQVIFVVCLFIYAIVLLRQEADCPTSRRLLFACASIVLCHHALQLFMIPKYYAKQFETWLSIICAMICVAIAIAGEFRPDSMVVPHSKDLEQLSNRGRLRSWLLQSVSVAILSACIQVMLLLGRFPTWGSYALMFSTVLKNVLRVFLAVIWIVVGFSLSFFVLFHNDHQFNNLWAAFAKTMVMMVGEYDYDDLFAANNASSYNDQTTSLRITSKIIFLVFVMLASIVLMNFMVGLAVTDIQGLLNEGLILRLLKQAEFVIHLEQVTSHWIFRSRLVPKFVRTMLESQNKIPTSIDLVVSPGHKYPRGISKKMVVKLFDLATKKRIIYGKDQVNLVDEQNEDSLIETILRLQEAFKKLQRKKIISPTATIQRRNRYTSF